MARSDWHQTAGFTELTRAKVSLRGIEGSCKPARECQPILRLCEERCRAYEREIALMESRTIATLECRDNVMVDTTRESIARVRERLGELETLLAEHGEMRQGERPVRNYPRVVDRLGRLLALAGLK